MFSIPFNRNPYQEALEGARLLMALITPYLNREDGEQYLLGTFLCRNHADHQT
ncbi:hypothetical protein DESA109040_15955 [Deinococcus saxicola]|uniref:hypothetical protein n=1 Tax=Deinococcus saxicola TaxID=249406 RepID=UPI0039EE23C9